MSTQWIQYPNNTGGSMAGVSSFNSLTGAVSLVAGANITLTPVGNTITIASTGGGGGSGTVTSVALTAPSIFNVSGSPVTTSGTLALAFASAAQNLFLATPDGSSGVPSLRAIVAADIPTLNQNTTGTAANITATSNSSLTTISSLSLPYSQVTGGPAALVFADSVVNTAGTVTLVNDSASPTASQYYGTDLSSVLGYHNLPAAGTGTVTSVSVVSANGLAGTVATASTTPAITLSTTVTGVLKGDGTAISAATAGTDYVIPSGSITGTASNITATTNSSLTTLSSLSLPGSQVSGDISGNAANITATSNSSLTTLSSLSLPYSQVTGAPAALIFADSLVNTAGTVTLVNDSAIPTASQYYGTDVSSVLGYHNLPAPGSGTVTSVDMTVPSFLSVSGNPVTTSGTLAVTLSGTALPVANGGTGDTSFTANQVILGGTTTTGPLAQVPGGAAGYILTSNGATAVPTFQPAPGTVSAFYASSQVNTNSADVTSTSFTTFDNSPAFTFTPSITGTYKVYSSVPIIESTGAVQAFIHITNTSGGAVLLEESDATIFPIIAASGFIQNVYTLTAGTVYVFDIQGKNSSTGTLSIDAVATPFYMFAELLATGSLPLQVSDINGLNGSLTLAAGTGLSLGTVGNVLTLSLITPVSIANGGTNNGSLAVTAGGVIYTDGSKLVNTGAGTAGQVLTSNGASAPTWNAAGGGGGTFQFFASSQVTTNSSSITATSFTTFDNSPAFTFTPTVSGTYKIYSSMPLFSPAIVNENIARIFNTSGGATLLYESQVEIYGNPTAASCTAQSVYTLVASTTYVFDIQGAVLSGGSIQCRGGIAPFYMFAELCG